MEMNSIDHEHEFRTLEKSHDQLKMLKCNDLTLIHKCIYFTCFFYPPPVYWLLPIYHITGRVNGVT